LLAIGIFLRLLNHHHHCRLEFNIIEFLLLRNRTGIKTTVIFAFARWQHHSALIWRVLIRWFSDPFRCDSRAAFLPRAHNVRVCLTRTISRLVASVRVQSNYVSAVIDMHNSQPNHSRDCNVVFHSRIYDTFEVGGKLAKVLTEFLQPLIQFSSIYRTIHTRLSRWIWHSVYSRELKFCLPLTWLSKECWKSVRRNYERTTVNGLLFTTTKKNVDSITNY